MWNIKIVKNILGACVVSILFGGCSDFFENDLTSVVDTDGRVISTERDAFYQICGILQQMQQVGDGRFISNELRGDLLTQTRNSSQDLRDIEFFEADTTNQYLNERKFYALVNNCNYYIDRIDRNVFGTKSDTLVAPVKCIRAWAYLQLALDYGHVRYFTYPILHVDESAGEITDFVVSEQSLAAAGNSLLPEALIDTLIRDLQPYCPADGRAEVFPFTDGEYATVNSYPITQLFIPIRFLLGELYLWRGDFSRAANMYYQLMLDRKLSVNGTYRNTWANSTCEGLGSASWITQFSSFSTSNVVSAIAYSGEYEKGMTRLPDLLGTDYQLGASAVCRELFENQQYTIGLNPVSVAGDLRGNGVIGDLGTYVMEYPSDDPMAEERTDAYITKVRNMSYSGSYYATLCRAPLVYLRYAEAVNRLGKHQLAMAVLKYGLTAEVLSNGNYISRKELTGETWLDFGQVTPLYASIFESNEGLHSRGCGDADMNASYVIDVSSIDSLTDVENKIMDEYVLECAFEGNRFHDLMRIAQYRSDPTYLAGKIAEKLAGLSNSTRSREQWLDYLSDRKHWFLPSCVR